MIRNTNASRGDHPMMQDGAAVLYSHVGYRREVGHVHTGRLYGHKDYTGRRHALNGGANLFSGAGYRSLCGEYVCADHDGYSFNVLPAEGQDGAGVSCKRCLRKIKAKAGA